jgi:hypothetical protein
MSETGSSKAGKKPRYSKAEVQFTLCNAINHTNSSKMHGVEFQRIFHIVEPTPGAREVLLEDAGGVVQYVHENAVTSEVLRYCHHYTNWPMFRVVDEAAARAVTKFWKAYTPPILEPAMLLEADAQGLCFRRLPFNLTAIQTSVFDEFLGRCSNSAALCGFVGSLLEPLADRQQYVYLHGDGMNGKGALLRFLARVMGPAHASKVPPAHGDRFWTHGLLGKRLVAFPDCSDRHFPASPLFKMLTGGDHVPVEQKNLQAYTAPLNCKFIFASNDEPKLSGQEADRRRAIYCKIDRIAGAPDPHYDDRLWAEAAGILYKCRAEYRRLTHDHGPILTAADSLDDLISQSGAEFKDLFERCFTLEMREGMPLKKALHFSPAELGRVVREHRLDDQYRAGFVKWLRTQFGIEFKKIKSDEPPHRVYVGACVKSSWAIDTSFDTTFRTEMQKANGKIIDFDTAKVVALGDTVTDG